MEISNRRNNLSQPTGVSTFAIRTSQRTDQLQRASTFAPEGKLFFKIPSL